MFINEGRLFVVASLAVAVLGGCGGEITALTLGDQRGEEFERFKAEIQPILDAPLSQAEIDAELGFGGIAGRPCGNVGCHPPGGFPPTLATEPNEAQLLENFKQFTDPKYADPNDPDNSFILTKGLLPPAHGGGAYLLGTDECCYLTLRAFIAKEDAPVCQCGDPAGTQ